VVLQCFSLMWSSSVIPSGRTAGKASMSLWCEGNTIGSLLLPTFIYISCSLGTTISLYQFHIRSNTRSYWELWAVVTGSLLRLDPMSGPSDRLTKIKDALTMNKTATTIPWDPDSTIFPTRKNLPTIPGAPPEAAWTWGEEDYIGRLNLLTPTRIKAASAEIKSGEVVPLE